jgi:hypothetical protein
MATESARERNRETAGIGLDVGALLSADGCSVGGRETSGFACGAGIAIGK